LTLTFDLIIVPERLLLSLHCNLTSSLAQSADGPQTAGTSYNRFRQSPKTFSFGLWDQSAVRTPTPPP